MFSLIFSQKLHLLLSWHERNVVVFSNFSTICVKKRAKTILCQSRLHTRYYYANCREVAEWNVQHVQPVPRSKTKWAFWRKFITCSCLPFLMWRTPSSRKKQTQKREYCFHLFILLFRKSKECSFQSWIVEKSEEREKFAIQLTAWQS